MSNNSNALFNAAAVATNHPVPASAGTTGTHATAPQGHAAAASGAAAHGPANAAAGTMPDAAGSGTTVQQWLNTQFPVGFAPGVPVPGTQPVFGTGQSVVHPGLQISNRSALRRTDSTTDVLEKKSNGQYFSVRMRDTVDNPFSHHFPPPPPFVDPTKSAPAPGNSGAAVPSTQPVSGAGQPASPPSLSIPNLAALRRTDSTTDWVEKSNGEYYSARMQGTVEKPFGQKFRPPPPFVDLLYTLPSAPIASSRPPPPVDVPEILPLPPIVIPANIFAPASTASSIPAVHAAAVPGAAAANLESRKRAYRAINVRAAKARRSLDWKGPGLRINRPHAHHITPDDCQNLRRLIVHRGKGDNNLVEAEALGVWNKNDQLHFLNELRDQDIGKPPHLRENFVTGAEVDMELQIDCLREVRRLAATQVAFVAQDFFPDAPPVPAPRPQPPPPPRSIWSVMAGAVKGLLKRKRDADDGAMRLSAKRARVRQEPEPQPRFVFLRQLVVEPPPRPPRGKYAETRPGPLPYHGAAAYSVPYPMSDFAMQTDEDSVSPAAAGPSHKPPSRAPSMTNVGVAGLPQQPAKTPPRHTPFVVAPGAYLSTVSPPRPVPPRKGKDRRVEFKPCVTVARPRRFTSPPPPDMVGTEDEDENEGDEAVDSEVPRDMRDVLGGALLTPEALAALGLDSGPGGDPAVRQLWSHPNTKYVKYKDATIQCEPGQKRRRGTRAGRKVQERRAMKEAATATKGDEKMVDGA